MPPQPAGARNSSGSRETSRSWFWAKPRFRIGVGLVMCRLECEIAVAQTQAHAVGTLVDHRQSILPSSWKQRQSTWKLWFTGAAAAQFPLPDCAARIVQVPAATRVTVALETVHTDEVAEPKITAR